MSNVTDVFFTIGFIVMLAVFGYKLYNLLSAGNAYDIKIVFISWITYLIAWLIGLVAFLASPEEKVFIVMFLLSSLLLALTTIFTIIELFIYIGRVSVNDNRQRRYSNKT